jgi:hypothetical protein
MAPARSSSVSGPSPGAPVGAGAVGRLSVPQCATCSATRSCPTGNSSMSRQRILRRHAPASPALTIPHPLHLLHGARVSSISWCPTARRPLEPEPPVAPRAELPADGPQVLWLAGGSASTHNILGPISSRSVREHEVRPAGRDSTRCESLHAPASSEEHLSRAWTPLAHAG